MVLGDRIELPTRGFSILGHAYSHAITNLHRYGPSVSWLVCPEPSYHEPSFTRVVD